MVSAAELDDRLNGSGPNSMALFITDSSQGRATIKFTIRYLQGDGPKCFDLNESQDALNREFFLTVDYASQSSVLALVG